MNPVLDELKVCRSVRNFTPHMPEQENLAKIMEAGLYAANGMGRIGTNVKRDAQWIKTYGY